MINEDCRSGTIRDEGQPGPRVVSAARHSNSPTQSDVRNPVGDATTRSSVQAIASYPLRHSVGFGSRGRCAETRSCHKSATIGRIEPSRGRERITLSALFVVPEEGIEPTRGVNPTGF